MLNNLNKLFAIDRRAESYLWNHPSLIDLLEEARTQIIRVFGSDMVRSLTLEVVSDPDSGGFEQLFLVILSEHAPESSIALLNRLDKEWWITASEQTKGLLEIAVE